MAPRRHEDTILWLAVAAAAIPAAVALPLIWLGDFDRKSEITLTLAIVLGSGGLAIAARQRVQRALETLANLVLSLRERDYAVRGRHGRTDDALGLALHELSALASELRAERHRDEEAAAGLARVVEGLDAAVLAFDHASTVRLANPAAERLVLGAGASASIVGRTAAELGLEAIATLDAPGTIELALGGGRGTWQARPSDVRLSGVPHRLVVMTDVRRALRAEERQAWQRLVRVLGHEINNSLGPIGSIAETLRTSLSRTPRPDDLELDLERGLDVIERRARALARFMAAYARLARLPPPRAGTVDVRALVARVVGLEQRLQVWIGGGPEVVVAGDGDQLEQLLINLVANAVDAVLEAGKGGVAVTWSVEVGRLELVVDDDGPGLADTANLFVPFFTTKPAGSGIGLVLARQIAEAHGGSVVLRNRDEGGCRAVVVLVGVRENATAAAGARGWGTPPAAGGAPRRPPKPGPWNH
jgi:nitrogen fixation/metabolism regulation signal transduction histidine kinase